LVQPLQPILRALPALLGSLTRPQALGHVELFSGTANALHGKGEPQPAGEARASLGYALPAWGLELAYRPGDFVQVNAPVNEAMIAQALDWLAPGSEERVLDLFCGSGKYDLPPAHHVGVLIRGGDDAGKCHTALPPTLTTD